MERKLWQKIVCGIAAFTMCLSTAAFLTTGLNISAKADVAQPLAIAATGNKTTGLGQGEAVAAARNTVAITNDKTTGLGQGTATEATRTTLAITGDKTSGLANGTFVGDAKKTSVAAYSAEKTKLYINEYVNGKAAVLSFPEINVNEYAYLDLKVTINVNYDVTFSTFKNDAAYTDDAVFESGNNYVYTENGNVEGYLLINLATLADENGMVSSFVLRHESSDTDEEMSGFTLNILGAEQVGKEAKYENLQYSAAKSKVYINNFTDGKASILAFPEIDVNVYRYLELTVYINVSYDVEFSFFKNDGSYNDGLTPESGNVYSFTKDREVQGVLKIDLTNLANENGKVSDLILRHESSDTASEISGFSLNIVGAAKVGQGAEYEAIQYSAEKQKLFINSFVNGKAIVLAFPEIDVNVYKYLELTVSINVNYDVEFSVFKADGNYNAEANSESGNVYAFTENGNIQGVLKICLVNLADENNKVNSIILRHESSDTASEASGFTLNVFGATATAPEDYSLPIDGKSMTDAKPKGEEFVQLVTHVPTNKLFANQFSRGKAIEISFLTPINTNIYKTLKLPIALKNVSGEYLYYLAGYKGGESPKTAQVAERYSVKNNDTVVLEINLEKYAVNGSVSSIVLCHFDDTYVNDYKNLSLYVFAGEVCQAKAQQVETLTWPCGISSVTYEKGVSAGEDRIVFEFTEALFSLKNQQVTDWKGLSDKISVNGVTLAEEDVVSLEQGYKGDGSLAALTVKSSIVGDGTDRIAITRGALLTENDGTKYTYDVVENYTYYFRSAIADGEKAVLVPYAVVERVETVDDKTVLVAFNEKIGDLSEAKADVYEKIFLNGVALAEIDGAVVELNENSETELIIKNISLKKDGTDTVEFKTGLSTEFIYLFEDIAFTLDLSDEWYVKTEDELFVLWLQNLEIGEGDGKTTFSIRLSREYKGENIVGFKSVYLDKIVINGKNLNEILADDEKASVTLRGAYLDVTLSASGKSYSVKGDKTDLISIDEGFTLPQGGTTTYKTEYVYDELWNEFSVVPNRELIENRVTATNVELVQTDPSAYSRGETMIFIKFAYPCSYRYYPNAHRHVSEMYALTETIAETNPTELQLSQMALYGVFDSVLDYLYFDGRSMREWLLVDKNTSANWKNSVIITYNGSGFNEGYQMNFYFKSESSASLFNEGEHYVEFKKGYLTPELSELQKDFKYKYDAANKRWVGVADNSDVEIDSEYKSDMNKPTTPADTEGGCFASVSVQTAISFVLVAVVAVLIILKKSREDCNE